MSKQPTKKAAKKAPEKAPEKAAEKTPDPEPRTWPPGTYTLPIRYCWNVVGVLLPLPGATRPTSTRSVEPLVVLLRDAPKTPGCCEIIGNRAMYDREAMRSFGYEADGLGGAWVFFPQYTGVPLNSFVRSADAGRLMPKKENQA